VYNRTVNLYGGELMLFDLVERLHNKRRVFYIAAFIIFDLWLLSLCNQTLQVHRADMTGKISSYESTQTLPTYQQAVLYGDGLTGGLNEAMAAAEAGTMRALVATTDNFTKAEQNTQAAGNAAVETASTAANTTAQAISTEATTSVRIFGYTTGAASRVATLPFVAVGQGARFAAGSVSKLTSNHLASVIKPKMNASAPVITPEQAQQVSIIQSGTLDVEPVRPIGTGGACDSGAGNGGYPMDWCDAPMDTIRTVAYSADRINRQCTSYAYWYFTQVKGHTDFHVTGNANRWAYTSNYPTHNTPAVGAIAVVTSGYYGHVAIVQALPGQVYDGKTVPDGYVLVSEMNYDWQGHFRYSYSPLSKFSAYIYP